MRKFITGGMWWRQDKIVALLLIDCFTTVQDEQDEARF